jgi:hypothetical protein
LFVIGIESANDGGQLFMLAIIVLALSLVVLAMRRKEIPVWLARLKKTS